MAMIKYDELVMYLRIFRVPDVVDTFTRKYLVDRDGMVESDALWGIVGIVMNHEDAAKKDERKQTLVELVKTLNAEIKSLDAK